MKDLTIIVSEQKERVEGWYICEIISLPFLGILNSHYKLFKVSAKKVTKKKILYKIEGSKNPSKKCKPVTFFFRQISHYYKK